MGSKHRLLPWIHEVLSSLAFDSALDAFSGSGCVSYLLKTMGKRVVANDFLDFARTITRATIENGRCRLSGEHCEQLVAGAGRPGDFIARTFDGIFFEGADLAFLDRASSALESLPSRHHRALARAALVRACIKRQPRGVFTVAGDSKRYDDGRRDLRLSLEEHFRESVDAYNRVVFDDGRDHRALRGDVFEIDPGPVDLVYLDPPYVPRSDDNCYVKRYHFVEGLVSYWRAPGTEIRTDTKVRKIPKRFTPFSYRRTSQDAFDALFRKFRDSTIVLSYSSNGYPDLDVLTTLLGRHKGSVRVHEREHRYHFGTHGGVSSARARVREYLIVGEG